MSSSSTRWTIDGVEARLVDAARTLKALPAGDGRFLYGQGTLWPDVLQAGQGAYGWTEATYRPAKPQTDDIARYEEVEGWIKRFLAPPRLPESLPRDTGAILWARAANIPWRGIGQIRELKWKATSSKGGGKSRIPGGNSRKSLRFIYVMGMEHLVECLNAEQKNAPRRGR